METFLDQSNQFRSLLAKAINEEPTSYIVKEIFSNNTTNHDLFNTTEEELMKINGIGKKRAQQILAVLSLLTINIPTEERVTIRTPEDAADYLTKELRYLQQEHFVVLYLNTKNEVIHKQSIFIGSLCQAIIHPREIFATAVKRSAFSILILHNHPSGNPTPSKADINVTKRLAECGKIMGIEMLDHIIIGENKYISLKEEGYV